MDISVELVKELRQRSGAGIMDCKRSLEEAGGDLEKAMQALRDKGIATIEKRSGRETRDGIVESYIHSGGRIGAMVELSCETDFVSRTPEFRELAHNLAMQVAAMSPQYLDQSEQPEGTDGNQEVLCLLQQPFIKDDGKVVQELITELATRVGENVRVRRFARFQLGE